MGFNKSHSAHVGGKIIDLRHPRYGPVASRLGAEVDRHVLDIGKHLIPFRYRLTVDRANVGKSLLPKMLYQVAANETTGSGDKNSFGRGG